MKVKSLSCVWLFATPWTIACTKLFHPWDFPAKVPEWVAISFSRRSSWHRMEPRSPALQADTLPYEPPGKLSEDLSCQFPASPDYRVPYFCSPSWAPFRGCWRLTATAAHDLILVEVDGKCPWQVSVCNWHGTRDHLVHNAWLMVREHTVNTNFLAPVSLGLCVHDHQVVNFFLWWRF